jgi:hypothetical protein
LFDPSKTSSATEATFSSTSLFEKTFPKVDAAIIIDRIGQLVLGIKDHFDLRASVDGYITWKDAISFLMDLGLRDEDIAAAAEYLENLSDGLLSFTSFIECYATFTGLANPVLIKKFSIGNKSSGENMWVPLSSGRWVEVDGETIEILIKAAEPYDISDGQMNSFADIWVAADDVEDIFMIAGLTNVTQSSLAAAVRKMAMVLPDISSGKLCFQELLTLFIYHHAGL